MRTLRSVFLGVFVLGLVAGCGSDSAVEVPENPAPKPKAKPVGVSNSLPADPDAAKSP